MKIDDQVEPLVREALAAAVKADGDRFARALDAFGNEAALRHGMQIAIAVAVYVILDEYGERPDDAELQVIAAKIEELEVWSGVRASDVATALVAAFDGRSEAALPAELVVTLPFIIAAYVLSAAREEDEQWFDYLDRAEAAIESR